MANPHHHTVSSIRKFKLHAAGNPADYPQSVYDKILELHQFFDQSKAHLADFRHRALYHHSEGIFQLEKLYGQVVKFEELGGREIPTRWIGEQHIREDLGFIPTAADWLREIKPQTWMARSKKISVELEVQEAQLAAEYDAKEMADFPNEAKDNQELLAALPKIKTQPRKTHVVKF